VSVSTPKDENSLAQEHRSQQNRAQVEGQEHGVQERRHEHQTQENEQEDRAHGNGTYKDEAYKNIAHNDKV